MKKIVYISPFAFAVSGADESLLQILRKLPKENYEPSVIVPYQSPYFDRYRALVPRTHSIFMMRLKRSKNPFYWLMFFVWFPFEVAWFAIFFAAHSIDLVHINMESSLAPAFAAKISRRPLVIHYRGKTVDTPTWFFDLFLPILSRLADRIFCISKASGVGFYRRNLTVKLEVLHNPVDLSVFQNSSSPDFFSNYRKHAGQKVITFVGRLDPQKRIVDLIAAANLLEKDGQDFLIAIVGGDLAISQEKQHLAELKSMVEKTNPSLPIVFLGAQKDIASILSDSAVLVLPSVNEGFGRVVIEAMACGTPVIAANSGALPEVLDNGTYGTLVAPCNPADLAAKLSLILRDDPTLAAKAASAKKYAERFSIETYLQTLLAKYDQLLSS